MKNMLRQFAILCGGDYQRAVLLNHLFYASHEQAEKNGNYTVTINQTELSQELGIGEDLLIDLFISLEEGTELINYDRVDNDKLERARIGAWRVTACTPNRQLIEQRLEKIPIEAEKIKKHNRRAIELNLPGTLKIEHWIGLLNHSYWGCTYCHDGNYEVLEHIVPLTFPDSGTTRWNCVPACTSCNALKGPYHPDRLPRKVKDKIGERLEGVRKNLANWKEHSERWNNRLKE